MTGLPPALPGTVLRIVATSDLGAATVPMRTSYGQSGTCAGVMALIERDPQPVVWLDVGDLVVGNPSYPVLGERPWHDVAGLPIAAAAAGNHDFDDGVDALREAAAQLGFPLLCANADVGLEPAALFDTAAGPLGVIGLTHPRVDQLSDAPAPAAGWGERVAPLSRRLRDDGARWVVALLHDGIDWWPSGVAVSTRADRLAGVAGAWAADVDLIVCGHDFAGWTGSLGGTPAGEPYLFASSVLLVDLVPEPVIRGVFRVPPVRPAHPSRSGAAVDALAADVVGELDDEWRTRTGTAHYLPDLIATALRRATGADAGLALPGFHGIQAPFDGTVAALGPGPVTALDVARLFGSPGLDPVVVELRPGELGAAVTAYDALADPRNRGGDDVAWSWCRMPAGTSGDGGSVALIPPLVPRLEELLARDLDAAAGGTGAWDAMMRVLS